MLGFCESQVNVDPGVILLVSATTASLDVDAQKGFTPCCPNELPVPYGDEIVSALNEQATLATYRIGSKDAHPPNASWVTTDHTKIGQPLAQSDRTPHMDRYWPSHCVVGSQGFELLDGLPAPIEYDFFVYKGLERDVHPYGCCYHDLAETRSTGIIEFLITKGVQTILVGGLALDYCVKQSALQLSKCGFDVIVNLSATKPVVPDNQDMVIEALTAANITVVTDLSSFKGE